MASRHKHSHIFIRNGLLSDLDSFSQLEQRISALPSEAERGNAFEIFAEAYLSTQKIVQATDVYPGQSIPLEILRAHGLPIKDLGADGVYQTTSGDINAYQVKFRTRRTPLTWEELGTFMGLTDQVSQRVLFTNCDDLPKVMNERSRFFCIRGSDLDRLIRADFEAMNEWFQSGKYIPKRKSPLQHQSEALEAISIGLENNDRVTAVMACGSGKTLVALWLAERLQSNRILVLVPSLALVRQTLHEWLKETQWTSLRFICVCSDPSVKECADELVVNQSDVDFPVTTSSAEVRDFLSGYDDDVRLVFTTYQSSKVVGEAAKGLAPFDLGIFDEAHKTAGREGTSFSFALSDRKLSVRKRVFLTATPRHYDINQRDQNGDAREVFSMNLPEVYGPCAYTLPFAEAARRGIICDYKIIISVITSEMLNDEMLRRGEVLINGDIVRARQVANQIALQKACEEHNLKKVFTFHSRVNTAREFTDTGSNTIATHLPSYHALHISGEMPTARRELVMDVFKRSEKAIMSNARCLTEGVDVPAVDMVAFMAPKKSRVDIVQATGRAMRKSTGKKIGYVMVPLYLEVAVGETIEEALRRTDFDEIWNVLQAMKEQDDVLQDIIRQLSIEKGRTGTFDGAATGERIEVLGPEVLLAELRQTIAISIVESLGIAWDERYGELQKYKAQYGTCNVSENRNRRLASWVSLQRKLKTSGKINPERAKRLEDLGFEWDPLTTGWERRYRELEEYKGLYGDCNVPNQWSQNRKLATWVGGQRKSKFANKLDPEKIRRLERLGFEWSVLDTVWESNFTALTQYRERFGNCDVPQRWQENEKLATWTAEQRKARKKSELSSERIQRLEGLGFKWSILESDWEEMFAHLVQYKKTYNHCNVPGLWSENVSLGKWVGTQRVRRKVNKISPERIRRLDELGFQWSVIDTAWNDMFERLVHYKNEHGNSNVPTTWKSDRALANWAATQRNLRNRKALEPERIARLDTLGFEWTPFDTKWERNFADLVKFKAINSHCNVPQDSVDYPDLAMWTGRQRQLKRLGELPADRSERLEEIGFVWSSFDSAWEKKYAELKAYRNQFGNCKVPHQWKENPELASWVKGQRQARKKNRLDAERIQRLDDLNFDWERLTSAWDEKISELKQFKEINGHCNVPQDHPNGKLATWVSNQRSRKKDGKLELERIKQLEDLGFIWNQLATVWEEKFAELIQYKAIHDHCNVPTESKEYHKLSNWLRTQRTFFKLGKLDSVNVERLNDLGIIWDRQDSVWEDRFAELVKYKEENGHCNVPARWQQNSLLAKWVNTQRANKREGRLSEERVKRLDELNFNWGVFASAWEARFKELEQYQQKYGNCQVPRHWEENPGLGAWVSTQRSKRKKGELSDEQIASLNKLGL